MRKKTKLLKEAREYTARFEGKLSSGGGTNKLAELKVSYRLSCVINAKMIKLK